MPTPIPAGAPRHTGGCLQPVLLRGRADYIDGGTGELIHRYTTVHEPGGVLPVACKTRRASRCPPCAEVYRADTYQLIRAGLTGGKGIPATVADHPCVFVTLTAPSFGPVHTRREGRQLDIRPVTANGDMTDTKVAGHVAKYATKAAECTGTLDRRITPADRLTDLPVRDHARRHIAACLRLGKLPQLKDPRLAAWAHTLGFRGHFSTKSRTYSVTLGSLRADRAAHQREYAIVAGLQPDVDSDTTLVLTDWRYAGRGDPLIDLLAPMGGVPCPGS